MRSNYIFFPQRYRSLLIYFCCYHQTLLHTQTKTTTNKNTVQKHVFLYICIFFWKGGWGEGLHAIYTYRTVYIKLYSNQIEYVTKVDISFFLLLPASVIYYLGIENVELLDFDTNIIGFNRITDIMYDKNNNNKNFQEHSTFKFNQKKTHLRESFTDLLNSIDFK